MSYIIYIYHIYIIYTIIYIYILSYIYIYHISYGRKLWQVASWGLFWPVSGPGARNGLNEPPGTCSGEVLGLGSEML